MLRTLELLRYWFVVFTCAVCSNVATELQRHTMSVSRISLFFSCVHARGSTCKSLHLPLSCTTRASKILLLTVKNSLICPKISFTMLIFHKFWWLFSQQELKHSWGARSLAQPQLKVRIYKKTVLPGNFTIHFLFLDNFHTAWVHCFTTGSKLKNWSLRLSVVLSTHR